MSESGTRNRRVSLVLGSDVRGERTLGEPVNATGAAVSSAIPALEMTPKIKEASTNGRGSGPKDWLLG
jgi:hypothetical protein